MLTRPHIEFIQAQMLPWRRIAEGAARPGAEYKFLSRDGGAGACSALIRYPPGWRREGGQTIAACEEFYVLDGEIAIDSDAFGPDFFGYYPARFPRDRISTRGGAVVLTFFDREPKLSAAAGARGAGRIVIDALHARWDMTLNDPNLAHLGISRKNLRCDAQTGERTFLSMILPHSEPPGRAGPQETHPVVEEAYVLSGSLTGPYGTMEPGAYFWRPAGVAHGPFGARWGAVSLIRFLGGRHENVWSKTEAPFSFAAPYRPVLPPDLAPFAAAPYAPPPRY
jgi:hypothetical protein